MSTTSVVKHNIKHKDVQPRQKRFKVGKACFTCRVKKIKCDGLQPCMQCKARSRPCTFSKDGITDDSHEENSHEEHSNHNSPAPSPISSPVIVNQIHNPAPKVVPSVTKKTKSSNNSNTNADNSRATEILNRLCKIWPGEGSEGKWELDQSQLLLPHKLNNLNRHKHPKVDLPTKPNQQHLIQLYFKHCYPTFPIVPKRLFYKHFESSTNKLLTSPILLLMMFAHGAQYQQKTAPESNGYFRHAKSLLDEEMNYPNLSTVIALALMSLHDSGDNQCSSMYSAMAFQMCLDLDLMRNYSGDFAIIEKSDNVNGDYMELKKRICWGCYYLDKIIHIQSGQPWILRSKDIELDMPLLQPGDDVIENEILGGFVATIKLLQIAERILQPQSLQQIGQPVVRTHTHDQMSLNSDNELLHWLRSLPSHLQWTPLNINHASDPPSPPTNPMICQIHLIYNLIELCVLKPYASSTAKTIHQRSIAIATNITRLVTTLSENLCWIFNFTFTVNALFESTKIHLRDCACESLNLARHARYMFQQSMQAMKSLLLLDHKKNSITLNITKFLTALDQALTNADMKNSLNNNEMNEDDMMTPFVLGSLNSRHGAEEERQQWSKLDYFANGLITPPTVKSKANLYYHPPSTAAVSFNPMYHHSASTDNLFQPSSSSSSWRPTGMTPDRIQYSRASDNPLDFLSSNNQPQPWQPAPSNNNNHKSTSVNSSPKVSYGQQQQQQQTPAELLLNQSDPSDIAALVAQIQEGNNNKEGNTSSNTSHTDGDDWNNTPPSTSASQIVTNHNTATSTPPMNNNTNTNNNTNNNEDLLYSLLSNQEQQQQQQQEERTSEPQQQQQNRQYGSFVQQQYPYMNVGLGIYASAHQHHNDVIRQHLPSTSTSSSMIRPAILTHQDQVIVTTTNENTNNHQ